MKIAINGFGRIGRTFLRAGLETDLEIVAINDLAELKTLVHLLKYDSNYGRLNAEVELNGNELVVNSQKIKIFSQKDPSQLPWKDLGVDLVIESTGVFTDYDGASGHLKAGAGLVVITAPAKGDKPIKTFVFGINEKDLKVEDKIISMASCTTNCLVPIAEVVEKNFGIEKSTMTTIHAYTMDQRLQDDSHKDLRRSRAAAISIIPTTTGATKAAAKVLPTLDGKMDGISYRVPTSTVSLLEFIVLLKKNTDVQEINQAFKKAAQDPDYQGALSVSQEPLVSVDFKGNPAAAIVDLLSTQVVGGNLARVVAWYDNELGYSYRLAQFCKYIEEKIN